VSVRLAGIDDASAIAALAQEMGYAPTTIDVMRGRLNKLLANADCAVFVFEREQQVLAWLHILAVPLLATGGDHPRGGYAEIGGLVVAERARHLGLARALIAKARTWATENGFDRLRVYNNAQRTDAHAAYRAMGFSERDGKAWTLDLRDTRRV
jgi:GNAT superfamily N-acetyltransferase